MLGIQKRIHLLFLGFFSVSPLQVEKTSVFTTDYLLKRARNHKEQANETATNNLHAGVAYHLANNHQKAIKYYKKAAFFFERESSDFLKIAIICNNLAMAYTHIKRYNEAIQWHHKSLAYFYGAEEATSPSLANAYNALGNTYLSTGKYNQALESYKKALKIYSLRYDDTNPHIIKVRTNLSTTHYKLGHLDTAITHCKQILQIIKNPVQNQTILTTIYYNLSHAYHDKKIYTKASYYAKKVRETLVATPKEKALEIKEAQEWITRLQGESHSK